MNTEGVTRLEHHLGRLLLAGVLCSSSLLLVGLVWWILSPGNGAAGGVLNAGLIVLMATPILRVMVSLVEYLRMRDWFFVLTTLAVLSVLFVSVALALRRA